MFHYISDLRCRTHIYSSNIYGTIVPIVVPNTQLFVYNIVRVISVAMLFFITGCILLTAKKQHKLIQIYVLTTT